jgi:creatinine amidohydrolase
VLSDWDLLRGFDAKAAAGVDVPSWDGHAGALETSRMMDFRPELVRATAAAHRVEFPDHLVEAHPEKRFPSGVMGDPTLASAALGKAANEWIVDRMIELISRKIDS